MNTTLVSVELVLNTVLQNPMDSRPMFSNQFYSLSFTLSFLTFCLSPLNAAADTETFTSTSAQTTLIELYTSDGCSSCPPADRWLAKFKTDTRLWQEIIPIAFHVDYWDNLGWKDEFATPNNSKRRRLHHQQEHQSTHLDSSLTARNGMDLQKERSNTHSSCCRLVTLR